MAKTLRQMLKMPLGGGNSYILEQIFISDETKQDYEIYLNDGSSRLQTTSQNTFQNAPESTAESMRKSSLKSTTESHPKIALESKSSQESFSQIPLQTPQSAIAPKSKSLIESPRESAQEITKSQRELTLQRIDSALQITRDTVQTKRESTIDSIFQTSQTALESKHKSTLQNMPQTVPQCLLESAPQLTSQTLDSTPQTTLESKRKSLESSTNPSTQTAKAPKPSRNLAFDSLDNIILKHHFTPNLIKIDTDGFDFKVIRSAFETLRVHKSAVYFEWDSHYLAQNGENPISIFGDLCAIGYEECIIFDNFGHLLCVEKCENCFNLGLLSDYMQHCDKRIYYFDVLVFHKDKPLSVKEFVKFVQDFTQKISS